MRWIIGVIGIGLGIGIVVALRKYIFPPPPGYSVALLGSLAVVMALVLPRKPSKRQKAAWIGCAFFLMSLEMWAIAHDRQEQTANFKVMLTDVEDSIKTQTGGDSFAFISFTAQPASSFEIARLLFYERVAQRIFASACY